MRQTAGKRHESDYAIIRSDSRFPSVLLDRALVEHMRARLPAQTKECVMATYGISANTWVKIKRGEPIHRATGEEAGAARAMTGSTRRMDSRWTQRKENKCRLCM